MTSSFLEVKIVSWPIVYTKHGQIFLLEIPVSLSLERDVGPMLGMTNSIL